MIGGHFDCFLYILFSCFRESDAAMFEGYDGQGGGRFGRGGVARFLCLLQRRFSVPDCCVLSMLAVYVLFVGRGRKKAPLLELCFRFRSYF